MKNKEFKMMRIKADYTIEIAAEKLGVAAATISNWENGQDIKSKYWRRLADLYGVEWTDIRNTMEGKC